MFACNGFDSNSDLSKRRPGLFAYEFNDPNAPSRAGVRGPGSNSSVRASRRLLSMHPELQYIFNLGADFSPRKRGWQPI